MDWKISGHKRQLDFLAKMMADGKLAHGFLFAGPEGVGKKTIAQQLASELGSKFPDYIEIDGREGIKIEQIRELVYKLSLKPYSAKYKVAVIDHAEEMTIEAANALLKSLEEPKAYTIIILITSNPNRLPKTIVSRTQKVNFGSVNLSDYKSFLPTNLSQEKLRIIEVLAAGRPGLALRIVYDESFLQKLQESENFYLSFNTKSLTERLILASQIAEEETQEIKLILENWLNHLAFELRSSPGMIIKQRIEQVNLSLKYLEQNANSKLMLANLMLNTI